MDKTIFIYIHAAREAKRAELKQILEEYSEFLKQEAYKYLIESQPIPKHLQKRIKAVSQLKTDCNKYLLDELPKKVDDLISTCKANKPKLREMYFIEVIQSLMYNLSRSLTKLSLGFIRECKNLEEVKISELQKWSEIVRKDAVDVKSKFLPSC